MPTVGWILYLIASWMLGHSIYVRLSGAGLRWLPFSEQGTITSPMLSTEGLRFLLRQIAAFWIGILILTTGHYGLNLALVNTFGYDTIGMPSELAASFFLIPLALLAAAYLRRSRRLTAEDDYRPVRHPYALFKRKVITWPFIVYILLLLVYSVWLVYSTFYQVDGLYRAGATVHSDLGPHTAMMSSFTKGHNIPTDYAHFAGDGIRYHFFFFYFTAILNQLGLGFVHALNIPSVLALSSMFLLIGMFAYRITSRAGTFMLAPLFTIFRSSGAIFTDLWQKGKTLGWFTADFFQAIFQQRTFIGDTPRDDWGLWTANAYANQRHLALGIVLLLLVILLALPDVERGVGALPLAHARKFPDWWRLTRQKSIWLTTGRQDVKRLFLIGIILFLMPYWHGSMTISALLVLAAFSVFAASRIAYLIIAATTFLSMVLANAFFAPQSAWLSNVQFKFGFIAEPNTFTNVLLYIVEMMGPAIFVLLISFVFARWRTKLYILAVSAPFIFAFLFQVTPDITVNHKFILISLILWNVIIAETVIRMFRARRGKIALRVAAILLSLLLISSGVYEHLIYRNINRQVFVDIKQDSEVNRWIEKNTAPRTIFLTAPYAYHDFLLTGRPIWYGHGYYAWSAGHDTHKREAEVKSILSTSSIETLKNYATENEIGYLLINDDMRNAYPDLNESLFASDLNEAAQFTDAKNTVIYKLSDVTR